MSIGDGDVFVENGRGFSRVGVFDEIVVIVNGGLVSIGFSVVLISSTMSKTAKHTQKKTFKYYYFALVGKHEL